MASDAQARLNIQLRELIGMFESNIGEESLARMKSYIESNQYVQLIEMFQAYGHCKPFIDHDVLANKVKLAVYAHGEVLAFERKNLKKVHMTLISLFYIFLKDFL